MYQVGPYEFTKQDARHTFLDLAGLWRDHVFGLTNLPAAVGERVGEWADAAADRIADHCLTSGAWTDAQVADELGAAWLGLRRVADSLRDAGVFGGPSSGTVVQHET